MENQSGDPEIDDDRAGVHDRSDQRSGHDRRVAVQFFCKERQKSSDQFGNDDRRHE